MHNFKIENLNDIADLNLHTNITLQNGIIKFYFEIYLFINLLL